MLIQIVDLLISLLITLFVIQLVISLLLQFDRLGKARNFAIQVSESITALMNPILAPIRRRLPATGAMDFSPLILIVMLQLLVILLSAVPI